MRWASCGGHATPPVCGGPSLPASQPANQPASQPTSQTASQPASHPTHPQNSQTARQPASQTASQPARQPTNQPTNQPTSQPASQTASQPARQPINIRHAAGSACGDQKHVTCMRVRFLPISLSLSRFLFFFCIRRRLSTSLGRSLCCSQGSSTYHLWRWIAFFVLLFQMFDAPPPSCGGLFLFRLASVQVIEWIGGLGDGSCIPDAAPGLPLK